MAIPLGPTADPPPVVSPSLLERFLVFIGYNLSEETKLERAVFAHLEARQTIEDHRARLSAAEQQQRLAAEHLTRLCTEGAPTDRIRGAKSALAERIHDYNQAREGYEKAVGDRQRAQEHQKLCYNNLVALEDDAYAQDVLREAFRGWWADRLEDGQGWWQG